MRLLCLSPGEKESWGSFCQPPGVCLESKSVLGYITVSMWVGGVNPYVLG